MYLPYFETVTFASFSMKKVPFKVSARTAKLIGRENFSNAEGAIVELVKNSYDANAKNCIIIFNIPYSKPPSKLLDAELKGLPERGGPVRNFYIHEEGVYHLSKNLTEEKMQILKTYFRGLGSIYIIDNGLGMDQDTILNQWMQIGTGNKEIDFKVGSRIKTGAKGIGRFALDRLGQLSEMYTLPAGRNVQLGYRWKMDWRQFDQPEQEIGNITAELDETEDRFESILTSEFKEQTSLLKWIKEDAFRHGTMIKIGQLKDDWEVDALQGVNKGLEALVPPKDSAVDFSVHFYHVQDPTSYGEVETAYFNDYDYKLHGSFDADTQKIRLIITRNELNLAVVKRYFAHLFKNAEKPYDIRTLEKKTFTTTQPAHELMEWEADGENKAKLKAVGGFDFHFYFLKIRLSTKENYPYKDFTSAERGAVMDKFGGVKIYRDSFKVRPYGENGNDWLNLGDRASTSPAGAGQRIGDWKVGPHQLAGSIHISRITNPGIIDKSDRGGLVENETFTIFVNILLSIIRAFEVDRSKILHPFYLENRKKKDAQKKKKIKEEAKKLAKRMMESTQKKRGRPTKHSQAATERSIQRMVEDSLGKIIDNEEEHAELAQIRSLASLGLVVAAFAHELKEIRNNADELKKLESKLKVLTPHEKQNSLPYTDAMDIFESLQSDNQKMVHWINYALTAIKSDKRKRNSLKFDAYFQTLKDNWIAALMDRNIILKVDGRIRKLYDFRAFEVDMDTIFSNLISNSIDAFNNLTILREREISIQARLEDENISIKYSDTATGLPDIFQQDKEQIFLPFVTSKRDAKGNNIGTGLGMYLVKEVVKEYEGEIKVLSPRIGFQLEIELPIRKKK